jgi:hypothetical protein
VNNWTVKKDAIKFLFTRCYNVLQRVYYFKGHEFSIKPWNTKIKKATQLLVQTIVTAAAAAGKTHKRKWRKCLGILLKNSRTVLPGIPKRISHMHVKIFPLVRSTIRAKIPFFHELTSSLLREMGSKNTVVGTVTRLRAARPRNYGSIHTVHKRLYSFPKGSRPEKGPKPASHSLGARDSFPGKGKAPAVARISDPSPHLVPKINMRRTRSHQS